MCLSEREIPVPLRPFFFFNDTATTEIYTLSLHDALPISPKLTQVAGGFHSEIWISRSGRRVNAKSIMGVMMLAAGQGTSVLLEAKGDDADAAIAAIAKLVAERFGESE